MSNANRWLLPDGVDEILPPQAKKLDTLRREVLDCYQSWGYELVMPPLIEFLDSLLILPSNDLRLKTCKIVDQLTGRSMGVRADITSQVARIDSHVLQQNRPVRLCYADNVLNALPDSLLGSRSPMKAGAELYGHSGIESDIEVINLMLKTLKVAGIESAQLALGHIGIYKSIINDANIDEDLESKLFAALQIKSDTEIKNLLAESSLTDKQTKALGILATLHGDISILDKASAELCEDFPALTEHLDLLTAIAKAVSDNNPGQSLYFDLCELRGYDYHTGVVFAAYVSDHGEAIANGGRYDDIGEVFGRARPATGFDTDLKTLLSLGNREYKNCRCIYAPSDNDDALKQTIQQLRAQGDKVIVALSDQTETASEMGCSFELTKTSDGWQVKPV